LNSDEDYEEFEETLAEEEEDMDDADLVAEYGDEDSDEEV
jgi:hypothetical protein